MQKIAIIPSKTENIPKHLSEYFEDAGWKVAVMAGCNSIFEAYTKALTEHSIKSDDTVVLCHDDISVLTNKSTFNEIIEKKLKEYKNKITIIIISHRDSILPYCDEILELNNL